MINTTPKLIKQCINPERPNVIVVIGNGIPSFLKNTEHRVVVIEEKALHDIIRYHKEGYKKHPKTWLRGICSEDADSSDVIEKSSRYYFSDLLGSDGRIVVDKCASRVDYLVKAYNYTGDINLFGLAKAHYLGDKSKSSLEKIQDKVRCFYNIVNRHEETSKNEFNRLMKQSNRAYLDSIINASIDFNPERHGILTHRGGSFDSFNINGFVTHPLKQIGSESSDRTTFPAPEITLIKSGTGTGKTELLIKILLSYHRAGKKSVLISNLRSVVESIKSRAEDAFENTKWKLDIPKSEDLGIVTSDAELYDLETSNHLVTTLKSLPKEVIKHRLENADLVVVDEFEKLLEAVYSTNENYLTKKEKDCIKMQISKFMTANQTIVLADADLTDHLTTTVVRNFSSGRRIVAAVIPPNAARCDRFRKSNVKAQLGHWRYYEEHLLSHALKPDDKNFIVCDSKKSIESWLIRSGFVSKSVRDKADFQRAIDERIMAIVKSDSTSDKLLAEQSAFLNNPSHEIHKYDTVIVSPVLKEGFDINTDHANRVTVFASGVLTPKELIQFASRLRTAREIVFALRESSVQHSTNFYQYAYSDDERFESYLAKHRAILTSNLHYSLYRTLQHEGFDIDDKHKILLKGDAEFQPKTKSVSEVVPDLKAMLRDEKVANLESQESKKVFVAVSKLKTILHLEEIVGASLKVQIKSSDELEITVTSIFNTLLDEADVVNHVLPISLKIDPRWRGQQMRGVTKKVNNLYRALGFKIQRTNAGKAQVISDE